MTRRVSRLAMVVCCLAIAACGGSNSSTGSSSGSSSGGSSSSSGSSSGGSSSGGAALSKAELIKQGEKICKAGSDKIDALGSSPSDVAQLGAYTDKLTKVIDDTVAEMRALKPPSDVKADYDKLLDLMDQLSKDAAKIPAIAKSGDAAKLTQVSNDLEKIATDGQNAAKRVGFTGDCTG